jgi:uncharacterized membrane protein YraQ (UPF0718 family)
VFELGILIYVLLGPAFLAAELIGGFVLIAIMYLLLKLTLPRDVFEQARRRLREEESKEKLGGKTVEGDWKRQLRRRSGWHVIGLNYFKTIGRIWRSVVLGFLLASFIVGLIPTEFWRAIFPESETFPGVVGNAAAGVTAGVLSFIGSIGNLPFAAALWIAGVSFGGVVALIYADLITIPVLNVWRRFFGWKAMAYVFAVFFLTMAASAVAIEYLFDAFGWVPERLGKEQVLAFELELDLTSVMTVVMLLVTAALWWAKRSEGKPTRRSELTPAQRET